MFKGNERLGNVRAGGRARVRAARFHPVIQTRIRIQVRIQVQAQIQTQASRLRGYIRQVHALTYMYG